MLGISPFQALIMIPIISPSICFDTRYILKGTGLFTVTVILKQWEEEEVQQWRGDNKLMDCVKD